MDIILESEQFKGGVDSIERLLRISAQDIDCALDHTCFLLCGILNRAREFAAGLSILDEIG